MTATANSPSNHDVAKVSMQEAQIVLRWLARLRWLAVGGQTLATVVAVAVLKLKLPIAPVAAIIAITAASNVAMSILTQRRVPAWLVPAVLMLDVCLLTALLMCSGGPSNPFSALYLVHVAMAVVTLGPRWPWLVVGGTAACYGSLFVLPVSHPLALDPLAAAAGNWVALVLVSIVIAYFVGRTTRSLRRRERELADARERAARNEQLAALTTLAAGAAHELNTPLSTIAVAARELELQSRRLAEAAAFVEDARLIRQQVDRCQFILGRMRVDVLHGEWQKRSAMSAADFVQTLKRDLEAVAGDSLRIECAGDLQSIAVPLRAVEQTVGILVDNALDASPDGSSVRLGIYRRNGHIIFEVEDEGPGMEQEVARRAGEPFFTTKPPGEGMGLGLFLARLVAETLGGSLRLQSQPGKGTRATLELPAT